MRSLTGFLIKPFLPVGEAVTLFQRHVAECVAKAAETRALPDSLLLLALRPKYVSFKLYFMAVKQAG